MRRWVRPTLVGGDLFAIGRACGLPAAKILVGYLHLPDLPGAGSI